MKIIVLASGSRGNATYIEYQDTKILIDMGVSLLYLDTAFEQHHLSLNDIDAVLISHLHSDHIKGLQSLVKKYHPKVYMSQTMVTAMKDPIKDYELLTETFHINNLEIQTLKTSHDVESYGFIITGDESLVYITDTGYLKEAYFADLTNKEYYVLESNHDVEMLLNGRYSYDLKQRVLSDIGHLSNDLSAYYLTRFVGNKTKCICLAHLSEENNTEDKALDALSEEFSKKSIKLPKVLVAKQKETTELVGV